MGAGMKGKPGNANHPGFTERIKINTKYCYKNSNCLKGRNFSALNTETLKHVSQDNQLRRLRQ